MQKHNDKKILISLALVAIVAGFFGSRLESVQARIARLSGKAGSAAAITAIDGGAKKTEGKAYTLGFAGDIMLDRGVKYSVDKSYGGDFSRLFQSAGFLSQPDVMFANLEGPVSDKGTDRHNLYSFRMDPKTIGVLRDAGIDVVSFANNHVGDWNREAFEDTVTRLKEGGIISCGAGMNKEEAARPAIVQQDNGYRIGYLCFSDVPPTGVIATATSSGIILASDPDLATIISNAKKEVDTLIVSFHWGVEYETVHNARQEEIAKRAIDAGADLIVGHHPHVAQDLGEYKGVPIIYSLGNFIFDQKFSEETMRGMYVTAILKDGKISDVTPHTTLLDPTFAPSLK